MSFDKSYKHHHNGIENIPKETPQERFSHLPLQFVLPSFHPPSLDNRSASVTSFYFS